MTLDDTLHCPLSPVSIISVTKMDVDHKDATFNTQTFSSHSVLTWKKGANSMTFKPSTYNIPELNIISSFNPLAFLTACLK